MFDKIKKALANRELRDIAIRVLFVGLLVLLVIGGTYVNRSINKDDAVMYGQEDYSTDEPNMVAVIDLDPPDEMEPEREAEQAETAAQQDEPRQVDPEAQAVFADTSQLNEPADTSFNVDSAADDAIEAWGKKVALQLPADGSWSRTFGYGYDESWGDYRFHNGCDMILSVNTEVLAAADGEVADIYEDTLWGSVIVLSHSKKTETVYKGLNITDGLAVGDKVKAGDVLGRVADPGLAEDALGSHLHFEVWIDGLVQDPNEYLN